MKLIQIFLRSVVFPWVVLIGSPGLGQDPTLKQAAEALFQIGVGISENISQQVDSPEHQLLLRHFSIVTPENCMKPAAICSQPDVYDFRAADQFVEFATRNGLQVVGHCLVWAKDDRTPEWFYRQGEELASRELLLQRVREHVTTLVSRYKGRITQWDVVNEALDDGPNPLRDSGWSRATEYEFIKEAFRAAHAADPNALLIYNDYNNEAPAKRERMIGLLKMLLADQVPVHAVGLQGHYEIDVVPLDEIDQTIQAIRELGLKVVISEVDIDVIPRGRWWAEAGKFREEMAQIDPYSKGCPEDVLQRQAEQYGKLFDVYRKHADSIVRVTFWNLHDGQSWLNYFPWNRVNYPLLFDRKMQPKPAFQSVVKSLTQSR